MADFTKPTVADMVIGAADINIGTSGSMHEIDWGTEDLYWQQNHPRQPWATKDRAYDYYRPAYQYGHAARLAHNGKPWSDVETDLESGWTKARSDTTAEWHHVRDAVHAAYTRHRP